MAERRKHRFLNSFMKVNRLKMVIHYKATTEVRFLQTTPYQFASAADQRQGALILGNSKHRTVGGWIFNNQQEFAWLAQR